MALSSFTVELKQSTSREIRNVSLLLLYLFDSAVSQTSTIATKLSP